jgi:hypothetical protein
MVDEITARRYQADAAGCGDGSVAELLEEAELPQD